MGRSLPLAASFVNSFPSSAWERAPTSSSAWSSAKQSFAQVRSQTEFGNEWLWWAVLTLPEAKQSNYAPYFFSLPAWDNASVIRYFASI